MISRLLQWLRELGELETDAGRGRRAHAPRWLVAIALALAATVIATEVLLDVDAVDNVRFVIVTIDTLLVFGFCAWLTLHLIHDPGRLVEKLYERRVDVLVGVLGLFLLVVVTPRVAGALVVGRMVFAILASVLISRPGERAARVVNLNPSQSAALSFAGLIGVGTLALMSPAATVDGQGVPFVDAFFTITSAVTVTGLVIYDTAAHFTPFGQAVILLGIQTGAIGIMVLGAAFILVVGGRLPQRQQVGLSEMLDVHAGETLRRLIAAVSATTLAAEAFGAVLLYGLWLVGYLEVPDRYDDAVGALWWAGFHAISAFCNAGFALSSDSLSAYVGDPVVCGVFMVLITAGGLGFAVMSDLTAKRRPWLTRPRWAWHRLQLQTRVVLLMTLGLNAVGFVGILFFEFDQALAPYTLPTKVNAALFQAVSLRTAGFNTIPMSTLITPTVILMCIWMFIGAGPGSTAGGVKTTTAVTVFFAVRAMLRGRDDVEIFGRSLPKTIVYRSISIVLIAGLALSVFLMALTATQPKILFEHLVFEAVSAMGTVGLSLGATAELDARGRVLIALLMYVGRLGPLTVALAVGERVAQRGFKFPKGHMAVG